VLCVVLQEAVTTAGDPVPQNGQSRQAQQVAEVDACRRRMVMRQLPDVFLWGLAMAAAAATAVIVQILSATQFRYNITIGIIQCESEMVIQDFLIFHQVGG